MYSRQPSAVPSAPAFGLRAPIHLAGPLILCLTYLITGVLCFFVMRALGEVRSSNLGYHSPVDSSMNISANAQPSSPAGPIGVLAGYRWQWPTTRNRPLPYPVLVARRSAVDPELLIVLVVLLIMNSLP